MKKAMEFDEFNEAFRNAYYDALAYKKDVVVDGYTFFNKWYIMNYFLDHEKEYSGTYTVGLEIDTIFEDDSYAEAFYELYLDWVAADNLLEQNETEQNETGKDDL